MIELAALETKCMECGVQLCIPCARGLTKAIQSLLQLEHAVCVVVVDKTCGLVNIHLFLEISIKERGAHIHVMYTPAPVSRHGQQ